MNDMTAITFSQNFLPWAAGETAWFSAAEAAVLVGKGVATDASSGSFAPNAALLAANPALRPDRAERGCFVRGSITSCCARWRFVRDFKRTRTRRERRHQKRGVLRAEHLIGRVPPGGVGAVDK